MTRLLRVVSLLALGACASRGGLREDAASVPARAVPGDTVRVIINHVLPGKRDQFEHFVRAILMPAMVKVAPFDPVTARQMRQARLLYPTTQDRDSTYAYIFIVDPVATSGSYSFSSLLTRAYGSGAAAEYMQQFREALARGQESYVATNASW